MGEIVVKEDKRTNPAKKSKRKAIWWRVLLAWMGGFIFFPLSVAGTVALIGTAFKVKQVVTMFGGNPDDVVALEYQDETILSMIMRLTTKEFKTLDDFNNVSPMVSKLVLEQINPKLYDATGFEFNWEEMKTVSIMPNGDDQGLGQYVTNSLLNGITIAHFVDTSSLRDGYLLFLFETDDNGTIVRDENGNITNRAFCLNDYMGENSANTLNGAVDKMTIKDIFSPEDQDNASGIVKTLMEWKIGEINDKVDDLTIKDFFTEDEMNNNSLINTLKDFTIKDFTDDEKVNGLKLSGFLESEKEGASALVKELGEFTIGQVKGGNIVNDLTLGAIFPDPSDRSSVITAVMENKRKEAYEADVADGYMGSYDDWVAFSEDNAKYKATVRDLSDEDTLMALKVSDFTEITDENSMMWSFKDDTLQSLKNKNVNELLLTDFINKDVYDYNPDNASKYNKVIHAIMDNKRKDDFSTATSTDLDDPNFATKYADWLDADEANKTYSASVGDLTNYDSIKRLELKDVINNDSGNKVLNALFDMHTTINSIGPDINKLKLGQVIDTSALSENSVALNFINAMDEDDTANIGNLGSKIGGVSMGKVFGVPQEASTYSDLTDEQKANIPYVLFSLRESTLDSLKTDLANLTIAQATDVTGTIFDKEDIKNTKVSNASALADAMKANLKLGDIITLDENSPEILKRLVQIQNEDPDKNLNTLKDDVRILKLSDIMNIYETAGYETGHEGDPLYYHDKSSQILIALKDVTLFGTGNDNLEYKLNNLAIKDVFTEANCNNNNVLKALWNNATYPNGTMPINEISTRINDVTVVEMLGDDIYEDPTDPTLVHIIDGNPYKKIKSTWWYLLTAEGETFTAAEEYYYLKSGKNYKINDMNSLVTNMQYHMTEESLLKLIEAGFIDINDPDNKLYKVCPLYDVDHDGVYDPIDGDRRYIDLSVSEFLAATLTFI